jgi:hypothetical protein
MTADILNNLTRGAVLKYYFVEGGFNNLCAEIRDAIGEADTIKKICGGLDKYNILRGRTQATANFDTAETAEIVLIVQNLVVDLHLKYGAKLDYARERFVTSKHLGEEFAHKNWFGAVARLLDRGELEKFTGRLK